jgi:hypothetical protein
MALWLHAILTPLCSVLGFFGGAFLGWGAWALLTLGLGALGVETRVVSLLAAPPLFVGGALLGRRLGVAFAVSCLPARCPACRGRAYYRPGRLTSAYHCRACGHVHKGPFGTSRGRRGGRLSGSATGPSAHHAAGSHEGPAGRPGDRKGNRHPLI